MANNVALLPPPAPLAPSVSKAAYVEEYNEEEQSGRPETRQTANISTKRSKADVAKPKAGREELSDSGYSSHTAATPASSAPSSLESKAGSNPPKIQENTAASKRKPVVAEKTVKNKSQSPEKPQLRRTQSKAKKDKPVEPPAPKHHESKPRSKSNRLLGVFQSSKPAPARNVQEAPRSLPVRPRTSTSQSDRQARPLSYHAGTVPIYMPSPMIVASQPSYPPPPTIFSSPSYPPPPQQQQSYFPPPQLVAPRADFYAPPLSSYPPQPRPPSRQWSHGQSLASRPQSMYHETYSQPTVEYGEGPVYNTTTPSARPPSRQPQHREPSAVSPEELPACLEDYYQMRPPAPKASKKPPQEQRPPIVRHAHTTSEAHPQIQSRRSGYEEGPKAHAKNPSPVKQTFAEHERSRRPAAGPPKRSDDSLPTRQSNGHGTSRTTADSNAVKQKRRASLYGHESLRDLEGSVEEYQASKRPLATPNPVDTLVRRKKPPGSSSDTSSKHSGKSGRSRNSREGSDVKSRRPSSEVKSRNENDGLAMRFNASQGVSIQMKGGIEGRTISLRQSRDGGEGEMELGIGSRGRTVGSRPPIAGREKSRRRYSYADGQGVTEVERPMTSSRPPRSHSYRDERGLPHLGRATTTSSTAESIQEEYEPVVVREKIITRSRSRRSSRSGYSGWGRQNE